VKEKPILFPLLALFFIGVAVSIPVQIALLYEHDLSSLQDWSAILIKITPLNWFVMLVCAINAFLAFRVSQALKYFIPLGVVATAMNNFVVALWGTDYSHLQASSATLGYIFVSYSYIFSSSYEALKNPKIQWWKIPPRYKQNLPVWIESRGKRKVLTTTFDISQSGTFLAAMNQYTNNLMNDLHVGEHINLYISTEKGDLKLRGTVVRKEYQSHGSYPQGMGVKFSPLGILDTLHLRGLLTNQGV